MSKISTFTLSRHSRLFSVPEDGNEKYLFVKSGDTPYQEEPYRAESYALAFIKEGGVKLTAGLLSWDVDAPAIITLAPSVIRYFSKRSDRLKMDVIFFKESFLLERHADPFFLGSFEFFEDIGRCVLPLNPTNATKFARIYDLAQQARSASQSHQDLIVRSYIFALLYELEAYYRQYTAEKPPPSRGYPLFDQFRKLLRENYMREHKLDFYSSRLHVTSKSLSAAVKKHTGKSAGKWIDDTIILEAKVLLQNKTLTVSQIAGMLNFSDQSVFGKFFRAGAGMSPVEYRKKFD
ncbi:helix-turn-helix domain-containing protein [Puia sp. P3]|uniref:helix-turn-helix domain-containing protein n=1 Tax=Puia sp. P3 TaxID=3423952 RepID=UPI003D664D17